MVVFFLLLLVNMWGLYLNLWHFSWECMIICLIKWWFIGYMGKIDQSLLIIYINLYWWYFLVVYYHISWLFIKLRQKNGKQELELYFMVCLNLVEGKKCFLEKNILSKNSLKYVLRIFKMIFWVVVKYSIFSK